MRNWFGKVRKQPGRNLDGRLLREKNKMKRKDRVLHKRRKRVLMERKGARSVMGARVGHLSYYWRVARAAEPVGATLVRHFPALRKKKLFDPFASLGLG